GAGTTPRTASSGREGASITSGTSDGCEGGLQVTPLGPAESMRALLPARALGARAHGLRVRSLARRSRNDDARTAAGLVRAPRAAPVRGAGVSRALPGALHPATQRRRNMDMVRHGRDPAHGRLLAYDRARRRCAAVRGHQCARRAGGGPVRARGPGPAGPLRRPVGADLLPVHEATIS